MSPPIEGMKLIPMGLPLMAGEWLGCPTLVGVNGSYEA